MIWSIVPVSARPWGCGCCLNCRTGMENYCESEVARPGGLGRNGGMANYLVVPNPTAASVNCFILRPNAAIRVAAGATCAFGLRPSPSCFAIVERCSE